LTAGISVSSTLITCADGAKRPERRSRWSSLPEA
jgi:hypothetical protein